VAHKYENDAHDGEQTELEVPLKLMNVLLNRIIQKTLVLRVSLIHASWRLPVQLRQ
jgi:hypothetical protein